MLTYSLTLLLFFFGGIIQGCMGFGLAMVVAPPMLLMMPAAIAVRPTGLNVPNAKYVQALSLTGVAAQNSPPSLVLPAGWFKPRRVVEVYVEGHIKVRLVEIIDRGNDYERCSYEMIS